ncbi:uncharacterized protein [Rutidosis leptorrhynchoides]|uniref:uncharacterized protein n=1 Tax=Rutidosis leptorrhynchoides TaxID=125765 RepID=UPI003A99C5C7
MDKTFKMLEFLVDDSDDKKIVSFVNSLTQKEDDGEASSSRVPRSRIYIARDREDAAIRQYLRKPTAEDIARLYNFHAQKHGLPGMLSSIDCMHWEWKNCPVAWQGQYTRGSNNDINVLNFSPLFNTIKDGTAPPSPFEVNGRRYERGYYLGDGIYPEWAMLVKAPHNPTDEPRKKFKRFQESARKDIEHLFGVLQGRFLMLKTPVRSIYFNKIRRHMYACVVLHNMIQENNGFVIGRREERMIQRNPPRRLEWNLRDRDARIKEIRDKQVHK